MQLLPQIFFSKQEDISYFEIPRSEKLFYSLTTSETELQREQQQQWCWLHCNN